MARKKTKEQISQEEDFKNIAKIVEEQKMEDYIESCYLPYSWSVCLDRALVYVEDGLKPIQRRILWTAYKNGLTDKSRKIKSATFDGKVLEYSPHGGCFRGDTLIQTVDYGSVKIEDLYKMIQDGEHGIKVFCFDENENNITIGNISNVWITKYVNEIHKISFSDGSSVYCTGNHPFMNESGTFVNAEDLTVGMPLKNYFLEDENDKIYTSGHGYVSTYDQETKTISYEADESCDYELFVAGNEIKKLNKAIPVYDFTEDETHNAFIVGKQVIDNISDKSNLICVHNSYGSIINIAESEVPGQPRQVRVPLIKIKGNAGGINQQAQPAAACFTGDTKIKIANGNDLTIKEIFDKFNGEDPNIYVYSSSADGDIYVRKVVGASCEGKKGIYKVTLDNDKTITCTSDHRFLMRNGEYKHCCDLNHGDVIMPFYERKNNGVTEIYSNKIAKYLKANKFDFDDLYMSEEDCNAYKNCINISNTNSEVGNKIVSVVDLETEELVYDIEVNEFHNFALDAGVFVHNSRYTETGLWPAAMELIKELDENNVDLVPNYNNSDVEPVKLPVRWPCGVINGVPNAMAVGFACNIPCHNPDEIMDACIAIAKNPDIENDEIFKIVKGPDFNCGCDIIANTVKDGKTVNGIKSYMETGSGSFVMKAKYELEEDNGSYTISFKQLPYKIAPIDVIEDLKKCYNKGDFRELNYWNDLSDIDNPVNLVIQTKKNINISKVISELYKKTCLRSVFAVNSTVVYNNVPTKMGIKDMLSAFIDFRKECTRRKLNNRLDKRNSKLHINQAIAAVLADIDNCISIIRNSDDESVAQEELMKTFSLDEEQAKYILSIQLRRLTKSDINEIEATIDKLKDEISNIEEILNDNDKFIDFIVSELLDTKKVISSPRKCTIMLNDKKSCKTEDKDVFVVFSDNKIKRTFEKSDDSFKVDDNGRIVVITKDKAFFNSVYELSDNRFFSYTRFKVGSKPIGVSSAEGYLILVGSVGNMKVVNMSEYKQPRKESIDKIMAQDVIFAKNVKNLEGELVINGKDRVKLSDLPIQGMSANGRKLYKKPIESVTMA